MKRPAFPLLLAVGLSACSSLLGQLMHSDGDAPTSRTVFDFTSVDDDRRSALRCEWTVVNDDVMGGRSFGGFTFEDGVMVFSGSTNTRGGGFSSIRTIEHADWGFAGYTGLELRVRGDARDYQIDLRPQGAPRRRSTVSYRTPLGMAATDVDEHGFHTVRLPFASFRPRQFSQQIEGDPIDPARIGTIGIFLYDKLDGPFRLEVEAIRAYR
jgi:NADH dehydrogenase [ubiquinone] 1 alpha subcomplex assembly factor 1